MNNDLFLEERISSNKTEALFVALTIGFFLLFIWRLNTARLDLLAAVFLIFFLIFLFYSLNFRTLFIRLTSEALKLTFGVFKWVVPLDNIDACSLDYLPMVMKYGGAGVHFMSIRNRYRASFNFLEYPRVVVGLKKKVGPVQDISFSTRQPEEVIRLIQVAVTEKEERR
jgi:hypothetical protein